MSEEQSLMENGFAAMARGAWEEARDCFTSVIENAPSAEAYEGLSWAAWSLNEPELLFHSREQAFIHYQQRQDPIGAARMAMWLGADYMDWRGELSIANGWRQRAERLLDGLAITPEHGWLLLLQGDAAIVSEEDAPKARELARRATEIGRALQVPDIEAIGLAIEGVALVTEGEVSTGMRLLEEASASALSGAMTDPGYVAWALCYLIYACERVRDYDRAVEWSERMREYADLGQMALLRGICRVRLAGVLIWRGEWSEAEAQLAEARTRFIPQSGIRAAEVTVRLAELRHRQGNLEEAEALFRQAEWHPLALLGMAELSLEAGRPKDAEEFVKRTLRQVPEGSPLQRAAALELLVRAQALLGDHRRAQEALDSIRSLSQLTDSSPLRAAAKFGEGALAVAGRKYDEAMAYFEDALDLYVKSGAPYESARARLELASVLVMLGRLERANIEATLASKTLAQLRSVFYGGRAAAILRDIATRIRDSGTTRAPQSDLTARQLEILRLMARGLSNREIAETLVLSEHTVHRHVANILQRLDLPTRAAAAAYATSQNLV